MIASIFGARLSKVQNDGDAATQIYALLATLVIAIVGGLITGFLMKRQLPQPTRDPHFNRRRESINYMYLIKVSTNF